MRTPIIVTPGVLAQGAIARWLEQYDHDCFKPPWRFGDGRTVPEIRAKFEALTPEEQTPERIAEIIGNDTWTATTCNQCDARNLPVVLLGEEPDVDSRYVCVCFACLRRVSDIISDHLRANRPPDAEDFDCGWCGRPESEHRASDYVKRCAHGS